MPSKTDPKNDGQRSSDAHDGDAAPAGRTAFDALNPYGDFGGTDPSSGRLLLVVIVCLVALVGVAGVGGLWAWDAAAARAQKQAAPTVAVATEDDEESVEEDGPPDIDSSKNVVPEPATEAGAKEAVPPDKAGGESATKAASDEAAPQADEVEAPSPEEQRTNKAASKRPPPPPPRALVLIASRDRSDAQADGLAAALDAGFVERVRALAPEVSVERGRPGLLDVGVKLVLTHFQEGSGGGAHDVTAKCAAVAKATDGTMSQSVDAQGRSQGVAASAELRAEAVRRCGGRLADALASVISSLN